VTGFGKLDKLNIVGVAGGGVEVVTAEKRRRAAEICIQNMFIDVE